MTKYLALDASTSNVGIVLAYDKILLNVLDYQPQGKDVHERIENYSDWLSATLKTGLFVFESKGIDAVFYEYPSGNKFHYATLLLGALWHTTVMQCRYANVNIVEVRPKEVKATGIYKVWSKKKKTISVKRLTLARQYGDFTVIKHKNDDINGAAMERQDDIIDAVGVWLAGLEKIKNE